MSRERKSWTKVKYSSSFYRKCAKTSENILRSTSSGDKSPKTKITHNAKNRNIDLPQDDLLLEDYTSTTTDEERGNGSLEECMDIRENWWREFEDQNFHEETIVDNNELPMDKKNMLHADFRQRAVSSNISQSSLRSLFFIINKYWPKSLPKDPRTLLETPNKTEIVTIDNGQFYWHQRLEYCITNYCNFENEKTIWININMDGIPIYKSSKDEFWPILFNIHGYPELKPMVIGIFQGKSKPSSVELFLKPFVEEFKEISRLGVQLENGQKINIKIRCFIADSPARAFIKGKLKYIMR